MNKRTKSTANWQATRGEERALKELVSLRIGPTGKRTFHCHVEHVHVGGGTAAIDYLERAGDFSDKDQDLEWVIGDTDYVREAAWQVDKRAVKRNGRTAEKVLSKVTFEMPVELDADGRCEVAERVVSRFRKLGYECCAAVHANDEVQPHVHVALTSRPVTQIEGDMWVVRRDPEFIFLRGSRQTLRDLRHEIASDVNSVLGREFFHGGRHIDVGITRKPKRRIPQRLWRQEGVRGNDPEYLVMRHRQHEEARRAGKSRAFENQQRRLKHIEERMIETPLFRIMNGRLRRLEEQIANEDRVSEAAKVPTEIVEVIVGFPVSVHADHGQSPATLKQVNYLQDMARKSGTKIALNAPLSRDAVGASIRQLENMTPSRKRKVNEH